jgi:hypothetical protein
MHKIQLMKRELNAGKNCEDVLMFESCASVLSSSSNSYFGGFQESKSLNFCLRCKFSILNHQKTS